MILDHLPQCHLAVPLCLCTFGTFGSNSEFLKMTKIHQWRKMNFSPFIPCFIDHSFLFLTFVSCHAGIFSMFSHSFSTAAFASGNFQCLMHWNKFVHWIVATEWIYSFCCNMILMIPTRSSFQSNFRGLVSFDKTSMFRLAFPNTAVGFPTAALWCPARHCPWHRNF